MEAPKDSVSFEVFGIRASAVGRFAIVALLIFAAVLVAFAAIYGPGQIIYWWSAAEAAK